MAGARPNFVKLAPLVRAADEAGRELAWIHTGQHRSERMSGAFVRELGLPDPLTHLRTGPPGPARIARLASRIADALGRLRPSLLVVLGDVDSTAAAAIAADRLGIPLAHVEAGLRSFDRSMPEERNRCLTDALADRLHLPEPKALLWPTLRDEGIAGRRLHVAGNVMADSLISMRPAIEAEAPDAVRRFGARGYVIATLHRAANVDEPERFARVLTALGRAARELPVVLPLHPRTAARLREFGIALPAGVLRVPPLPYVSFLAAVRGAACVLTDSGGLQVEAALLRVRCVTARARTEHGLTASHGNVVAGTDARRLPRLIGEAVAAGPVTGRQPRAWDGHAATRIVTSWLATPPVRGPQVAPEGLLRAVVPRGT